MNALLLTAQHAVQDRKLAAGVPRFEGVMAADQPGNVNAAEHRGLMTGTDLTDEDVTVLAEFCARAMMGLIVFKGADLLDGLVAMYREGLLVGIEYAKRAGLT